MPPQLLYDAFISYRRQEPDLSFANDLLRHLEAAGYKVAIDWRDFAPNLPFLEEMERCVKESRFTLAVVSPRYLESGNCIEEGVICTVLDLGERKRRLIPLVIEKTQMPAWLYLLTGIDCTHPNPPEPWFDKLQRTLECPPGQSTPAGQTVSRQPVQPPNAAARGHSTLSRTERMALHRSLNALPQGQLDMVIFALSPPAGIIHPPAAPQSDRVWSLLQWAEGTGGCGLDAVRHALGDTLDP